MKKKFRRAEITKGLLLNCTKMHGKVRDLLSLIQRRRNWKLYGLKGFGTFLREMSQGVNEGEILGMLGCGQSQDAAGWYKHRESQVCLVIILSPARMGGKQKEGALMLDPMEGSRATQRLNRQSIEFNLLQWSKSVSTYEVFHKYLLKNF